MFCEGIIDFRMAFDGLFLAGRGVQVDVVPGSMAVEYATRFG